MASNDGMTLRTLVPFLAISFGLTWGIAAALLLFTDRLAAIFGPLTGTNPLFVLAVYSPGIAAVFLIWRRFGLVGLGRYFRRLTLWRMPMAWWAFLLLGIPAVFYLGAAIKGTLADPFPFTPWYRVLPAMATALFIGPIEEFGWRGLAQPLLQRRLAPFWAGLVLGVIWALWHIPAFALSGSPQSSWSFPAFFFGVVAMAVILTPMFNAAGGSLLVAALFHFQANGPAWPDAQPWDTLVVVVIAVVVVWLNRETMFQRGTGATDVMMPTAGSGRPPGGE
ncbi:MAG: type II CAAX prenyl endopeptidase Rce1 family protein [Gemmatimonadales bacterium]